MNFTKKDAGVIFDLDGTLLDSLWVWEKIDRLFLEKRGIRCTMAYIEKIASMEFREVAEYTIAHYNLPESVEQLLNEWHEMAIMAYSNEIKLKDNALSFLQTLIKRGMKLGVVTSLSPALFIPALKNNGIDQYFSHIMTTAESGLKKTDQKIYLDACEKILVDPSKCIVFDDMPKCILAAKEAGAITFGVFDPNAGFLEEELRAAADYLIRDFHALENHVVFKEL